MVMPKVATPAMVGAAYIKKKEILARLSGVCLLSTIKPRRYGAEA
jgi:hypothetical protein